MFRKLFPHMAQKSRNLSLGQNSAEICGNFFGRFRRKSIAKPLPGHCLGIAKSLLYLLL